MSCLQKTLSSDPIQIELRVKDIIPPTPNRITHHRKHHILEEEHSCVRKNDFVTLLRLTIYNNPEPFIHFKEIVCLGTSFPVSRPVRNVDRFNLVKRNRNTDLLISCSNGSRPWQFATLNFSYGDGVHTTLTTEFRPSEEHNFLANEGVFTQKYVSRRDIRFWVFHSKKFLSAS